MVRDGEEVASHADVDDEGQSVAVAKPAEEAPAPQAKGMPQIGDALPVIATPRGAQHVLRRLTSAITIGWRRPVGLLHPRDGASPVQLPGEPVMRYSIMRSTMYYVLEAT